MGSTKILTLCLAVLLVATANAQQGFVNDEQSTRYAAFSVVDKIHFDVSPRIGTVSKHPKNPLLVQDQPWEPRLDNAYPNIVHEPSSALGAYRMWYGGFIAGSDFDKGQGRNRVNAFHYANSSDGITWEKPSLKLFDLSKIPQCSKAAKAAGLHNNLLFGGDGTGIFFDQHDVNSSRRFKAFGTMCPDGGAALVDERDEHGIPRSYSASHCVSGTAVSADGLQFGEYTALSWPSPQRYDCHQNIVRDPTDATLVYTTRDGFSRAPGRTIGIARGPEGGAWGGVDTSKPPEEVEDGTNDHQLYAQVTFPFYNCWLGLVAVFDTKSPTTVGTIHTRLSWANSPMGPWKWLDGGLTGSPFIPLGDKSAFDSHIVFPGHSPFFDKSDGKIRVYYAGGNGPHNGARNTSMGMATLRPDGFGGMYGTGSFTTHPLLVTGPTLIVTADIVKTGGSLRIGAVAQPGLELKDVQPIESDVTDTAVHFSGVDFTALVGKHVQLAIDMTDATVYTMGFSKPVP